jgi:hypothetical protein
MDLRIFKYPLRITDPQVVVMPLGARVLSVQEQPGSGLCCWALVDTEQKASERRTFHIRGTGHPVEFGVNSSDGKAPLGLERGFDFVGTVQQMSVALVWHVFVSSSSYTPYTAPRS